MHAFLTLNAPIIAGENRSVPANRGAFTAALAQIPQKPDFRHSREIFGICAPLTPQRAAFQKHNSTDSGTVVN
jgi:hypothetical protein